MGKGSPARQQRRHPSRQVAARPQEPVRSVPIMQVDSLLDSMHDGNEYQSIVDKVPRSGTNLFDELARAIGELEQIRARPCLVYVGNVVKKDEGESSLDSSDDLPFREMVAKVPAKYRSVDIYLATRGGSAQQVSNFVNCLRARFDDVHFLIPSFCMSAGTLFALSGDQIWMTDRACLGPVDPQVPTAGGRYVPAQALLSLLSEIQQQGDEAMKKGLPVPWALVRAIDSLDKKELGEALTASQYAQSMASQFLQKYKFRNWTMRETSKTPVTEVDRAQRASEIAAALGSHDRWKSHGHSISRDVLWNELRLKIDHPDGNLNRSMVRLWAIVAYILDKSPIIKILASSDYRYAKQVQYQLVGSMPGVMK